MSAETERLRGVARRYCKLIESLDERSRYEFLVQVNAILPELYRAAVALPDESREGIDPVTDSEPGPTDVLGRIETKLADAAQYRGVFDPWAPSEEAMDRSLADDLADIYQDLSALQSETGGEVNAWDLRFAFSFHWGAHAAQAMLATHWLVHHPGERWIGPDDDG